MGYRSCGAASSLDTLPTLTGGDHVCWVVGKVDDFEAQVARCITEGRACGDRLLLLGPRDSLQRLRALAPDATVADPAAAVLDGRPLDPEAMLRMFRDETAAARAEGHRGLRVVADMDWLREHMPSAAELQAFELLLDRVVWEIGATVVCAYRRPTFDRPSLEAALVTHPFTAGAVGRDVGFRVFHDRGGWRVRGAVDFASADRFGCAMETLTAQAGTVRLDVSELDFIDVGGLRTLAATATEDGGLRVLLHGAHATLRRIWSLLGYDRLVPNVEFVA